MTNKEFARKYQGTFWTNDADIYILAVIDVDDNGDRCYSLVSIKDGNRWMKPTSDANKLLEELDEFYRVYRIDIKTPRIHVMVP